MEYETVFTFFTGNDIQSSNRVLMLRTAYDDTDYPVYYETVCCDNTDSTRFYSNKFDTLEEAFNDFKQIVFEYYIYEI